MTNHKFVSFIKSGIRMVGCIIGAYAFHHTNIAAGVAFWFIFVAELVGIVEEQYE